MPDTPKTQQEDFSCFIEDQISGDKFSAEVTLRKRKVIRETLQRDGKIEICDILIRSVSNSLGKRHHHFIMTSLNGDGLYIFRRAINAEERRYCSIWDLGPALGHRITNYLKEWH